MPLTAEQIKKLQEAKNNTANQMQNQQNQQQKFVNNIETGIRFNQDNDDLENAVKFTGGHAKPAKGGGCEIM